MGFRGVRALQAVEGANRLVKDAAWPEIREFMAKYLPEKDFFCHISASLAAHHRL